MSEDTETATTLFDKIVELTGLEREDEESAEDFKARVVRHFADKYPNTDEGNEAFSKLDEDVTEWVDEATEVVRNNRGARNKKRLPELEGLEEDEEKPKRSRRASADGEKKPRKEKEPKEPKERKRTPESNRFFRVAEFMIKDPSLSADQLVDKAAKPTGYSERSIRRVHEAWTGIHAAMTKHGVIAGA